MMTNNTKTPLYRDDDNKFLGYVASSGTSWQALTIFGTQIELTTSRKDAERILKEKGLPYLMGVWQYYDSDDHDWYPCIIKEAYENKVIVNRTTSLGYQDPDDYKQIIIEFPSENNLSKSS